MDEFETAVIQYAMDWAEDRHARDHLGQPTEAKAAESLKKLFDACSQLHAESEGSWSPSDNDAPWIAYAEKQEKEARERFEYFDSGPGWRTHCSGATGAESAARYWRERQNIWQAVLDLSRNSNSPGRRLT